MLFKDQYIGICFRCLIVHEYSQQTYKMIQKYIHTESYSV